jgi:hypothetical protein
MIDSQKGVASGDYIYPGEEVGIESRPRYSYEILEAN